MKKPQIWFQNFMLKKRNALEAFYWRVKILALIEFALANPIKTHKSQAKWYKQVIKKSRHIVYHNTNFTRRQVKRMSAQKLDTIIGAIVRRLAVDINWKKWRL